MFFFIIDYIRKIKCKNVISNKKFEEVYVGNFLGVLWDLKWLNKMVSKRLIICLEKFWKVN